MTFGIGIISLILLVNNEIEQRLQRDLSETDMVVGAKGSPLQLILSSVYHIDNPTGNIALEEANRLKKNRLIKWAIPLSFGDAYREFRIVGTNEKYLELYNAEFDQGKMWNAP
ncbi:MAG: ABC transporter permease, partial [Flavobacteriales bacterium]|nr:ABC transporter permease [Flavobacteriales bacterium]